MGWIFVHTLSNLLKTLLYHWNSEKKSFKFLVLESASKIGSFGLFLFQNTLFFPLGVHPKISLRTKCVLDILSPTLQSFIKPRWENSTKRFCRILQDISNDTKYKKFKKVLWFLCYFTNPNLLDFPQFGLLMQACLAKDLDYEIAWNLFTNFNKLYRSFWPLGS